MKLLKMLILIVVITGTIFAQESLEKNTELLFTDSTATRDANGMYYITLVNADTVTSGFDVAAEGKTVNMRLNALLDTTSGTTLIFIDLGIRVFSEGTVSTRNTIWTMVDSLIAGDDGTPITIPLSTTIVDPGIGYYYRLRQTGTQTNRVYISRIVRREKTR